MYYLLLLIVILYILFPPFAIKYNNYRKKRILEQYGRDNVEPLPHLYTQEEVNEIDDSINIEKFMKDVYHIYKEYEESKQYRDYDKMQLLLGHDLKVLTIEKTQQLERLDQRVIYKGITCRGGGICHIYKYGPVEKIDVILNINRVCYTVNKHNTIIDGDENPEEITYRLTFEKTKNGYPSNCPQCGASLEMNDECKCVFCDSFISNTYGDYKLIFKETLRRANIR